MISWISRILLRAVGVMVSYRAVLTNGASIEVCINFAPHLFNALSWVVRMQSSNRR